MEEGRHGGRKTWREEDREGGRHGGRKTGREEASLLGVAVNQHTVASNACTVALVWCFDTVQRWYGVLTCTGARPVALIWQQCGIY